MAGTEQLELKRLGFIKNYASLALSAGEGVYKRARGFVPSAVEPYVSQAEDSAVATAAPYAALANDKAAEVLAAVDAKVESLLGAVTSSLDFSRDLHSKNMSSFAAAKESAYGLVEAYVNAAKSALDPARYVEAATGFGKAVVGAVAAYADPDKAVDLLSNAYDKLAAQGPSERHIWGGVQPLYKKIYETATTLPSLVADTTLYRRGYPLVAPVADPVLTNFSKSKVLKQLEDHLKPKTA
ncbi:hypothetical protein Rsub_09403 [Raphidocelis subcapitata]|uniref:Uncharacterized protein n=1 Tax=Raphidocelis subcapitata TaxID=307507 RepID=A0A2V0PEK9_9CHLO|nr:hypothetical protein Rsub_09403 [Raphidocelis subcapitata]|eukprot:GBF96333.1 hypothetical protein Rsub_09403 [Raphidocelis subcapitata]